MLNNSTLKIQHSKLTQVEWYLGKYFEK